MSIISRRVFVASSSAAGMLSLTPVVAATVEPEASGLPPFYPAHSRDDVRTVVGKSHVDYDTVRAMVTERPELAKAAWDWGFGDWESALGAASHMGRRDIAEVLMENGARPNLFTFAMMGQRTAVEAICDANPGIQRTAGPHGISLLQHARRGGKDAAGVVAYLEGLGDADGGPATQPLSADDGRRYVGVYGPEAAPDVRFNVGWHERRGGLTLRRDEEQFRFLLHHGSHRFSPGGAPSVRVVFGTRGDAVAGMTIHDGPFVIATRRLGS